MKKYLFVGEERSERAKQMNVTWVDKRLAAAHLSKALDFIGIDWNDCEFKNIYEDDIEEIKNFNGIVIGMGNRVQKELTKLGISHESIIHPAARGTIRIIDNYKNHVKEQIGHIV